MWWFALLAEAAGLPREVSANAKPARATQPRPYFTHHNNVNEYSLTVEPLLA